MNRSLKIFLACGIGAFIGSLIALDMSKYFWWVGLLVGGFIGYLGYNVQEIPQAARKAYSSIRGFDYPTRTFWKCWMILCGLIFVWTTNTFSSLWLFFGPPALGYREGVKAACIFCSVGCVIGLFILMSDSTNHSGEEQLLRVLKKAILYSLPPVILFLLFRLIWKLVVKMPVAIKFAKTFLIQIHSDLRLLCGIGAAIGTCIGYFAGSAVIGALAGGVFGVFNYEVISKLVLKIQSKAN